MARHIGTANLIPYNKRSKEEVKELQRKGGYNSGKTRKARKTFREQLKIMLASNIPRSSPLYKQLKDQMDKMGLSGTPTVQDIPLIGMVMRSMKDHKAAEFLRDTIGERPVETIEDVTPQSPIVLELPTDEELAAIREQRETRNANDE